MRRILLRIFVGLVAVILLAAVVVQIVLLTDFPRSVVQKSLETQLGLRADIGSLSTGWLGRTTLHDVSFSLPVADRPLLSADTLDVEHTWLIPLLLGSDLTITRLDFHQPGFRIARGGDGRWNVQQIADVLASRRPKSGNSSSNLVLPAINLIDGHVEVIDGNRDLTIEQVNFSSKPEPLSWKFDLSIADRLQVRGRLAPGGAWEHEATLQVSDISPWAQPWLKLPADASVKAIWHGRLSPAGIQGRLDASEIKGAGCAATGAIDIAQSSDGIGLRPDNLRVTTPHGAVDQFTAVSGDVRYQNGMVRAQALQLNVYGGLANLSGNYDLAAGAGELNAAWANLTLPGRIVHGGTLALNLQRPFPTQLIVGGTLFSYATTPQGPWRTKINFSANGNPNGQINWQIDAPELAWNRRTPIRFDGLEAVGVVQRSPSGPVTLTMSSIHLPDHKAMNGTGSYSDADRSWVLKLSGNHWPLQLLQNAAIGFDIDAKGNADQITLNRLTLTQADTTLAASGSYRFGIPKPLNAVVTLTSPPPEQLSAGAEPIVQGAIHGTAQVEGTIAPLNLSLGGHFYGRDVRVADRQIGDVTVRVTGEANAEHAQIATERLAALGGDWSLRATYVFADELLDADLRVGGLPLQNIGRAADTNLLHGTVAGEWDAYVLRFPLNLQNIRLRGEGWVSDLQCRGLCADQIHFTTAMDDGTLMLDPITLQLGATGHGTGTLAWSTDDTRRVHGAISLADWPVARGKGMAVIKLDVPSFSVELPAAGTSPAPLEMYADAITGQLSLQYNKQPIGNLALAAEIYGQFASITELHGSLLDAPVNATAELDLTHPLGSRGSLSFENLDASHFTRLFPQAGEFSGAVRGVASFGPATSFHPLEPMALHLQASFDHGSFRSLPIGVLNLNGFMNTSRIVLDDQPGHNSTLEIAGGTIRLWGRAGNPSAGNFSSQAVVELSGLDLNELAHCANPDIRPMPGRISGNIMLLYNPRAGSPLPPATSAVAEGGVSPAVRQFVQNLYGEGRIDLTGSDIGTLPIFSDLYNLSSLGSAARGPIGHGSLEARLENGKLINNVHYFNRGTDVLVQLASSDIWDFPNSDINGYTVYSLSPFSALTLPLVSDLDSALATLQGNLNSYRISGTWMNRQFTQISLSDLGKEMKDLLVGNISNPSPSSTPAQ